MKRPTTLALATLVLAGALPSIAGTSQKSGDTYVYAPTTMGSRDPLPFVAEPIASAATGAPTDTGPMSAIVEQLNADASLKGSKFTVAPDGEGLLLTGVTVTRDQMKRAVEIATSQAGTGKVVNAIQTEELVIEQNPVPAEPSEVLPAEQGAEAAAPAAPSASTAL